MSQSKTLQINSLTPTPCWQLKSWICYLSRWSERHLAACLSHRLMKGWMLCPVSGSMLIGIGSGVDNQ